MTDDTKKIRKRIFDFPMGSKTANEEILGAKIKIIAYLTEDCELAKRGLYISGSSKHVEGLLSKLSGHDVNKLPLNLKAALEKLSLSLETFEKIREQIIQEVEYIEMFSFLAHNLSLDKMISSQEV